MGYKPDYNGLRSYGIGYEKMTAINTSFVKSLALKEKREKE